MLIAFFLEIVFSFFFLLLKLEFVVQGMFQLLDISGHGYLTHGWEMLVE